jgi:hypothetical protein
MTTLGRVALPLDARCGASACGGHERELALGRAATVKPAW